MIKKAKTKSPSTKSNINFKLIIFIVLSVGILFWRFQSVSAPVDGPASFKATLLEEPKVYERMQYFVIDRYSLKTSSGAEYAVGDVLQVEGKVVSGRLEMPKISKVGESTWRKKLFSIRSGLKDRIFSAMPQPQASFLAGVVLGAREELPSDFKDNLIKTGTIHVVVVSGYNISVVGGFLASLAVFIRRRTATILAILGIGFYTLLVGADPPALRAAIMGSLAFFAVFSGRQKISFYSLFLSGVIMFLISPNILINISFQLSFLATSGIIFFHEKISSFFNLLPRPFNEDLATTVAAQILVVPVIFYHFGSVSLISPLVNSLILWIIPLSTIAGFVFLAVSFVVWPFALVFSWLIWALLSIFIFVVEVFGRFDLTYLNFETGNLFPIVLYYLVLGLLIIYLKYGRVAIAKQN